MRIATWNINSVRLRINQVISFLEEFNVDVLCLQETKVVNDSFPSKTFLENGYFAYFNGIPSYNGVAILSKKKAENVSCKKFCQKDDGRHIQISIGEKSIHSIYIPAGGDIPDPSQNIKFKHKLDFLDEMHQWTKSLKNSVLCGDFNIAPFKDDVWSHKALENVVSHTQVEREKLIKILHDGNWIDCVRELLSPPQNIFTWWSYRSPDFTKNNRGRRLDHIWASQNYKKNIKKSNIIMSARKQKKPSDHVPIIVDIEN